MTARREITTWLRERDGWSPKMDQAANEIDRLRAVVRFADEEFRSEWGTGLADAVAAAMDDKCAGAVRRALKESP